MGETEGLSFGVLPEPEESKVAGIADFHYIKADGFRTFLADGVFGGTTPHGRLYLGFFVERGPIPVVEAVEILQEGGFGKTVRRESKNGVIRELQTGVVMDLEDAKSIAEWLSKHIQALEKLKKVETLKNDAKSP